MTQVEFSILKQHSQCSTCKYFLCYCCCCCYCCLGASCCAVGKCARITHTTPRLMATKPIGEKGSQYACKLHTLLSFNLLSGPSTAKASGKWQVAMAMAMAPALVFLCPVSGSALFCLPRLSRILHVCLLLPALQ